VAEAVAYRIIYVDALCVVCAHNASAFRANKLHSLLILVVCVGPLRCQVVLAPVRVIPRSLRAHTALLAAVTVTHIITSVSDTRSMRQVYQSQMLGLTWQSPQAKTVNPTPQTHLLGRPARSVIRGTVARQVDVRITLFLEDLAECVTRLAKYASKVASAPIPKLSMQLCRTLAWITLRVLSHKAT
jgi:hypothetical protein